jgi:hypothetical protein
MFPFYPPYPFAYSPYPAATAPFAAAQSFMFEVMAEQPVRTDSRTFNTWGEALAHAQNLFTATPGATRVVVTDQNGVRRVVPGAYGPAAYGPSYFPTVVQAGFGHGFGRGIVTVAGPYGHLGESGTVGQRPVEAVNGSQRLGQDARNYAVGVLAGLYAAQGLEPAVTDPAVATAGVSGFTFYTADAWRQRFPNVELPQPGLSAPGGSVVVINVDDLLRFGQGQQRSIRAITTSPPQAMAIALGGSEWALLESAPIGAPERRGFSPAVIAALAAAAVAALLLLA